MPDDLDLRDLHGRYEPDPAFRLELRQQVEAIVRGTAVPITPNDSHDSTEEDLIMLTDTRTQTPPTPKLTRRWLLPAAVIVLVAAVAAAVAIAASDDGGETTIVGTTSTTLGSNVVLQDDFSDDSGLWESTLPDVTVEGGHQVWTIPTAGQVEFLRPQLDAHDPLVNMEVTAKVAAVDPDSTVGVYCRKGVGNQDFYYYFRLGPKGVLIGAVEADDATLNQVLSEDASYVRPDAPFEITARCTDMNGVAQLRLLVDGVNVISGAHAAPLPAGYGALEVEAGPPGSEPSEVRWDEVTIKAL